ncbi:hypothetical protein EPO17_01960, partial [Patescibacteria group bacterium]
MDQKRSKSNKTSSLEIAIVQPAFSSNNPTALCDTRRNNTVFSSREIDHFYGLYRNGRVQMAVGQTYLTRYTALEDFIFETRRSSGVIEGYSEIASILIEQQADDRADLMRTWLCHVAPSCVFRHRSTDFGQTSFFRCCFRNCATPLSSQFALIRHYREQHYSQIPPGIFGTQVIFNCDACGMSFKREEHLNQHFSSLGHITQMAMRGIHSHILHILCWTQ